MLGMPFTAVATLMSYPNFHYFLDSSCFSLRVKYMPINEFTKQTAKNIIAVISMGSEFLISAITKDSIPKRIIIIPNINNTLHQKLRLAIVIVSPNVSYQL